MTMSMPAKHITTYPLIRLWLWSVAGLIFAMVLIGGATRLTDSGLSITEWQPLMGVVPPLSEAGWNAAFEKYKSIPEYQIVNQGMSLAAFKFIYWWEWTHRFLGRLIGFAVFVPLAFLWATQRLEARTARSMILLLALGGAQGALGWYMVKSGLADRTDVSQYRLAAHLTLAAAIYATVVWIALGIGTPARRLDTREAGAALGIVLLILLQISLGGLVAGLDAGLSHNTFPLMDGKLVPDGLMAMSPRWLNLFENALTVQFIHRTMAYAVSLCVSLHAIWLTRSRCDGGREISGWGLVGIVLVQMGLGIATLLWSVPLLLALLHQAGAMLLLTAAVIHLHLVIRRI
jgi:cytochrome c oxidase assembly protein subunit 15